MVDVYACSVSGSTITNTHFDLKEHSTNPVYLLTSYSTLMAFMFIFRLLLSRYIVNIILDMPIYVYCKKIIFI